MLMRKTLLVTLPSFLLACVLMWPSRDSSAQPPSKDAAASPAPASSQRREPRRSFFAMLSARRFDRGLMEARYRAVSIPINEYELTHVRIGDRVDVLATFSSQSSTGRQALTATMLQNVQVLGVLLSGRLDGKGAIILKVNPNEAQYAALGVRQADCSLSLRDEGDDELYPMEMANFSKFFR